MSESALLLRLLSRTITDQAQQGPAYAALSTLRERDRNIRLPVPVQSVASVELCAAVASFEVWPLRFKLPPPSAHQFEAGAWLKSGGEGRQAIEILSISPSA